VRVDAPSSEDRGSTVAAISNGVVGAVRSATGRGPTHARTIIERDLVVVVLDDILTKHERRLADDGEAGHVLEGRALLQEAMREELVAIVEKHTSRGVRAFLSANGVNPDLSVEIFLLEPDGSGTGQEEGPP
jgi:uncharacterized protein YbcI